jgi:hypothetical protein
MTEQLDLLGGPPVPLKPRLELTEKQRAVLLELRTRHPLTADDAGAIAHELKTGRWGHTRDTRCDYCGRDGRQILDRLVDLGLAKRKRGAGHMNYHPAYPDPDPVAHDAELAQAADRPVNQGGHGQLPQGF